MPTEKWTVTYIIRRQKAGGKQYDERFSVEVSPDEFVLDGIERIWAFQDRSLTFRHACHHATCGACGMLVNGVEKLTCITPIRDVTKNGGTIKVEPLRNFPVISDLVVDLAPLYQRMEEIQAQTVLPVMELPNTSPSIGQSPAPPSYKNEPVLRLVDCIECGLCISACPVQATNPDYIGPAIIAAAQLQNLEQNAALCAILESEEGVWQCHSAFECTAVCPSNVEPAWRIMEVRKQLVNLTLHLPLKKKRKEKTSHEQQRHEKY